MQGPLISRSEDGPIDPGADGRHTGWSIRTGRMVSFGPEWTDSDGHLVFDEASGDYWVLSPLGRRIVETVRETGFANPADLVRRLAGDSPVDAEERPLLSTISELVEARLLQVATQAAESSTPA
ncbi:MAG: hypothetical protein KGL43_03090 [Burkholderiales bacterium]|nr:hypothetical protein [Burkholderiales bacterium]MDE2452556.1 hypothetical protein [Burkholderiales bacterium]